MRWLRNNDSLTDDEKKMLRASALRALGKREDERSEEDQKLYAKERQLAAEIESAKSQEAFARAYQLTVEYWGEFPR